MFSFELSPQMKDYLKQIVLTDSEFRQHLKEKRLRLLKTIADCEAEIEHIEKELRTE